VSVRQSRGAVNEILIVQIAGDCVGFTRSAWKFCAIHFVAKDCVLILLDFCEKKPLASAVLKIL
jgi:hypothetical protein